MTDATRGIESVVQIRPGHLEKNDVLSKEETESSLGVSWQNVNMSEVLIFIVATSAGVAAQHCICRVVS